MRPAVKMTAMVPPAEMMAVTMTTAAMAATMMATAMTAAASTAVAAAMTAFCDREVRHAQRHCEHNGGNSQYDP